MKICKIEDCNELHYGKGLCKKHYMKQWREDNKEKLLEYRKQYHQDNKEHILEYASKYRRKYPEYSKQYENEHKEQHNKWARQYYKTPIGKASRIASNHRRRILLEDLTKETIQQVYEDNIKKYGTLTCILCNKPIEFGKDSLEHLTPLTKDGSNNYNNLGVSHLNCNRKKHTMTLEEWNLKPIKVTNE